MAGIPPTTKGKIMPRSFAQPHQAPCPECGTPIDLEIWLIVDIAERPDLARRLREGENLHAASCPKCAYVGGVDAPLLVHDPEWERVFFVPAQGTTKEQDRELARSLMGMFAQTFEEPPEYLTNFQSVPRELVPSLLAGETTENALMEMLRRGAEEIQELGRENPEEYERLMAEAAEEMGEGAAGLPDLPDLIDKFIGADTWSKSRALVEAHPELLNDKADSLLSGVIDDAVSMGDENVVRALTEHRELLRQCRTKGVAAAFAEKMTPADEEVSPEARQIMELLASLPNEIRESLVEAMKGVSTPEEFMAALNQRPELRAALENLMSGVRPNSGFDS